MIQDIPTNPTTLKSSKFMKITVISTARTTFLINGSTTVPVEGTVLLSETIPTTTFFESVTKTTSTITLSSVVLTYNADGRFRFLK